MKSLLLAFFFSSTVFAKSKKPFDDQSGSLQFERTLFNFGTIKRGETVEASFPFHNAGHGPITILGVQTSCGCTTVKFERGRIYQPGENNALDVAFDSTDFSGSVVKPIIVITNERLLPNRTLTVSGIVNAELAVDPPVLDFGEIKAGEEASKSVNIQAFAKDVKFVKKSIDPDFLKVVLDSNAVKVLVKKNAPVGFIKHTIFLTVTGIKLKELKIPVRADIIGPVSFSSKYVEFGSIQQTEGVERTVDVKSPEGTKIWLDRVDVFFNGEIQKEGKDWLQVREAQNSLKIKLQNTKALEGSVHGKLYFNTSEKTQKEITLDYFGLLVR